MKDFKIQFTLENFDTIMFILFGPRKPSDPILDNEDKIGIMKMGLGINNKNNKNYILKENDWLVLSEDELKVFLDEDYKALFENIIN